MSRTWHAGLAMFVEDDYEQKSYTAKIGDRWFPRWDGTWVLARWDFQQGMWVYVKEKPATGATDDGVTPEEQENEFGVTTP